MRSLRPVAAPLLGVRGQPPVPQEYLEIRGARVHNLKNISLRLPHNQLIVVTGVSGSGKSSLVFDIVYAEGRRRYVESLSSYARQFLERMERPDADEVLGIAPTVAIRQKNTTRNPRSTVATTTEIADFLRLLFARAGRTYCTKCGDRVSRDGVESVTRSVLSLEPGSRWHALFPISLDQANEEFDSEGAGFESPLAGRLAQLRGRGFNRLFQDGKIFEFSNPESLLDIDFEEPAYVLVDRLAVSSEIGERVADAVEISYRESGEIRFEQAGQPNRCLRFSSAFECRRCGLKYQQLRPPMFSLHSPEGRCPSCLGSGLAEGYSLELVLDAPELSLRQGPFRFGRKMLAPYLNRLIKAAAKANVPIDIPYQNLKPDERKFLEHGGPGFGGLQGILRDLARKRYKPQVAAALASWRGQVPCDTCDGRRFAPAILNVRVGGMAIDQVLSLSLEDAMRFFQNLELDPTETKVADRVLTEILNRLRFLTDVGLGYLSLDRKSNTLSGGEAQRIQLASSLGSRLVGVCYVLDEPSIGLHSRDTARLIRVLQELRDLGNTIFVVEHDREVMRSADRLVDLGPVGGEHGGRLLFNGSYKAILAANNGSITARYLSGRAEVPAPARRRPRGGRSALRFLGAQEHNLKGINVEIPLGMMTVVTGVSGSGKSTLLHKVVYDHLNRHCNQASRQWAPSQSNIEGATVRKVEGAQRIEQVVLVDQSANDRGNRSVPATYMGVFDDIRNLFARTSMAINRGYTPSFFSFNVDGASHYYQSVVGRCPTCRGTGLQTIDMQFLADVELTCEECQGRRFQAEILEVEYRGKSIWDVLQLTVDEALQIFSDNRSISNRLQVLSDVGLGYIRLGQPAGQLSGGEAQRMKLAMYLADRRYKKTLYLFDEPTTGLHFEDIKNLLAAFDRLIENGASVMVVEHNLDVIKCADWIIDLGPEGGEAGGEIVACGPPETIAQCELSHTGRFLRAALA